MTEDAPRWPAPDHLPPDVGKVWEELVNEMDDDDIDRVIGPEFDAYCGAVTRLRDAQRRIHDEELIVPDGKGAPVAHPAFAIERQSMDDLRKWGDKFRP